MREKDEFDLMLDAALATYADPGPDSGLEERVAAALAAAEGPGKRGASLADRRRRWLVWSIAIPAAVSVLLWIAITTTRHSASSGPEPREQNARLLPPGLPGAKTPEAMQHSAPQVRAYSAQRVYMPKPLRSALKPVPTSAIHSTEEAGATPLPKLDVFPTPQPLTAQEQDLLVFAERTPAPQLQAISAAQAADENPFPVAAAHIPPLETPAQGQN